MPAFGDDGVAGNFLHLRCAIFELLMYHTNHASTPHSNPVVYLKSKREESVHQCQQIIFVAHASLTQKFYSCQWCSFLAQISSGINEGCALHAAFMHVSIGTSIAPEFFEECRQIAYQIY
eukprot:m.344857 g.344857  ORF g.344857 m.344857 type:complete len:120 (+) comp20650_c0_seq6:3352-3711(+)